MFLNGELQPLDGNDQVWSLSTRVINIAIWLLVILVAVIVGCKKVMVEKVFQGLCVYIALIQTVTLGYLMITTDFLMQPRS